MKKLLLWLFTFQTFTIHTSKDSYDFVSFRRYRRNLTGKTIILDELKIRCKAETFGDRCSKYVIIDGGYPSMSTGVSFDGFRRDVLVLLSISGEDSIIYVNGARYLIEGFKSIVV
jgi:hypothetical protein